MTPIEPTAVLAGTEPSRDGSSLVLNRTKPLRTRHAAFSVTCIDAA